MADYVYAAQIAQQGMRDLGSGLRQMGSDKADKALGEQYKEANPDATGQFLGESLRRHKMTPGEVVQIQDKVDSQDGMQMYWGFVKKAMDPSLSPEQKKYYMDAANIVSGSLEAFAAQKKGKGKGGDGSKKDGEGPGGFYTGETLDKEMRKRKDRELTARMKLDPKDPNYLTRDKADKIYDEFNKKLRVNEAVSRKDYITGETTRTIPGNSGSEEPAGASDPSIGMGF